MPYAGRLTDLRAGDPSLQLCGGGADDVQTCTAAAGAAVGGESGLQGARLMVHAIKALIKF